MYLTGKCVWSVWMTGELFMYLEEGATRFPPLYTTYVYGLPPTLFVLETSSGWVISVAVSQVQQSSNSIGMLGNACPDL